MELFIALRRARRTDEVPRIGTAAWTVPKIAAEAFPSEGSHLVRYSSVLNSVEINSSFYKDHQAKTYRRWAEETPAGFRFSAKLSRVFTHDERLKPQPELLKEKLGAMKELGHKLEVLLVQLPPSLKFEEKNATPFLTDLRRFFDGSIVIEPRHTTWVSEEARTLLYELEIDKVIADPEPCPSLSLPAGTRYFRLHGSPEIYRSAYEGEAAEKWWSLVHQSVLQGHRTWCVFDNTTFGFATTNAIDFTRRAFSSRDLGDQSVNSMTQ